MAFLHRLKCPPLSFQTTKIKTYYYYDYYSCNSYCCNEVWVRLNDLHLGPSEGLAPASPPHFWDHIHPTGAYVYKSKLAYISIYTYTYTHTPTYPPIYLSVYIFKLVATLRDLPCAYRIKVSTPQISSLLRPWRVHGPLNPIVNPRKLEHGFRMISAGIPYTLP